MNELDEVIKEFLTESRENLDRLDRDLITLERDPTNRDGLASIFRTIHTIKGTCGFFEFTKLGAVTHAGENLLSQLREGQLLLHPGITNALLALSDAVRTILNRIETTGQEGEENYAALIATLHHLQAPATPLQVEPVPVAPPVPVAVTPTELVGVPETTGANGVHEPWADGAGESSIRVHIGLLDKLITLVGELVLARNQILQFTSTHRDTAFQRASQRLNLITSELQEGVMKTRMQPIANIWNKFPRVARDLALTCGKQIKLDMEGKDTELDKSIIEAIKDPLTHLLRNAIDHGIETPETRRQRGKPADGQLCLRAYHEGGQVNIEFTDDGGGIDPERVKDKALERRLITREQAGRLSPHDLLQLIFLPGFSTAAQVTSVSGRGVGMDVVKTNIEKIGGTVDIQSRPGLGTMVKVKIPLTLAIIPALLVHTGGDCYAIPQANLVELVRLEGSQGGSAIEKIHGTPVYRLRGKLLPLVHLADELKVRGGDAGTTAEALNIVVLQADDSQFGLIVDRIRDTAEIVVKPLGKQLKGIPVFAGATILGDGKVALILDVLGLAQKARVISGVRERGMAESRDEVATPSDGLRTMLLLGLGKDRRLALPLSEVARLEEIPTASLEHMADQEAVQYRGHILPLIRLARYLPGNGTVETVARLTTPVVVYARQGRRVGLIVDRILDIVETRVEVQPAENRPGILGSAVIQNRVTDLIDVEGIMRVAASAIFESAQAV